MYKMMAVGHIACSLLLLLALYLQTTTAVVSFDDWCLEHGKVYGRGVRIRQAIYSTEQ